ncbi:MAG: hypothetical protein FJ293_13115, partial [Planctomycetes bacterium]|nr:hypothetical protein [Planctomycetota bacterium]
MIPFFRRGRRCLAAAASLLAPCACALPVVDSVPPGGDEAATPAALERAVAAARLELTVAEAELAAKSSGLAMHAAERALRQAEREHREFESGRELARRTAELELAEAANALAENEQELAQLELMYAEQDLADKTRELVIGRTQRRLELARTTLILNQAKLARLNEVEQPGQAAELADALAAARGAIEAAAHDQASERLGAELSVLKARHALAAA